MNLNESEVKVKNATLPTKAFSEFTSSLNSPSYFASYMLTDEVNSPKGVRMNADEEQDEEFKQRR